jgi:rubrerythrin
MARLEAQSKLLYYPTPPAIVELISTWFTSTANTVRLVDPCCGTGAALAQLAKLITPEAETWGIEISYSRAEEASKILSTVLPTSFYDVRTPTHWSDKSVSLAFNNPPYDWSQFEEMHEGKKRRLRHEVLFIEWTTPKIALGGHHVIIVPQEILGDPMYLGADKTERIARHLYGWFEYVSIMRFPDDEFQKFGQVVILAIQKREKYQPPKDKQIEYMLGLSKSGADLPVLKAGQGEFTLPAAPAEAKFIYKPTSVEDLVRLAEVCSPVGTPEFERATYVRPLGAPFQPAVPINLGHMTMLINGQETGILTVQNGKGPILVKGMTRKVAVRNEKPVENDKGDVSHYKVTEKEKHVSTLATIEQDRLQLLQDSKAVSAFMVEHATEIADAMLAKNNPLYDWKPTRGECEVVDKVAIGLPALPGRKERGLFAVQKHFAVAASRVMRIHKHAILVCEMGFGKTSTSIGALELLDEWPVIVMCPGHMLWKWKRDLERASNPDDPIAARVITRPVLSEPPAWLQLKRQIEEAGGRVISTERLQVDPVTTNDPGGRRKIIIEGNNQELVSLLYRCNFTDKDANKTINAVLKFPEGGIEAKIVDRDEYTLFDFVEDFTTRNLGRKAVAIISFDSAKYDAGAEEEPHIKKYWRLVYNEQTYKDERRQVYLCPDCGEVLPDKLPERCPKCKSALYNFSRWRRTGLARLVQHKFPHFFKVFIADEVHKAQNGRTDIGVADQRILSSVKYSLALTGTLFGGTSSSLFYLLYRRVPEVRQQYAFSDQVRWVDHYGLWEREWDQKGPITGESGKSTGIQRWNFRQRELPGVSPSVIRYLLPVTLFGNITDLGYELPGLFENVETLNMLPDQANQYEEIENDLLREAAQLAMKGDPGALSAWFSAARFRPASAFRNEVVDFQGKKGGCLYKELPAVTSSSQPWLPKEIRLAEIVRHNMHKGRKTLVFVEQSGTRDIRGRLSEAIGKLAPGGSMTLVEVSTLSASDMAPAKREAWISQHAPRMDALLVNPRLIETGLDLVMFSDLVFYETTTSLYTLWQAMRRVWRLGQSKDVTVTFLAYAGTMEEEILRRMGVKMKYAQLLYGKEAAGTLIEVEDNDIQREILAAALEGKAFRNAGDAVSSIFTTGTETSVRVITAPTGSPVATSPTITIVELPRGKVVQLTLFPGFEPIPLDQGRIRRHKRM